MHPNVPPKSETPELPRELKTRKPYKKPQVIYSAPLEAMAAVCGIGLPNNKIDISCVTTFS